MTAGEAWLVPLVTPARHVMLCVCTDSITELAEHTWSITSMIYSTRIYMYSKSIQMPLPAALCSGNFFSCSFSFANLTRCFWGDILQLPRTVTDLYISSRIKGKRDNSTLFSVNVLTFERSCVYAFMDEIASRFNSSSYQKTFNGSCSYVCQTYNSINFIYFSLDERGGKQAKKRKHEIKIETLIPS